MIKAENPTVRFWRNVNKNGDGGCWLWTGFVLPNGYGTFFMPNPKRKVYAHRFSYEMHKGLLNHGQQVCHHCDVRNCVNPDHLFAGSQKDNIQDASRKGRLIGRRPPRGTEVNTCKLTEDDVKLIRLEYGGKNSSTVLGRRFGVSHSQILEIVHRRSWKHIQ